MSLFSECKSHVLGRLDPITFLPLYPHSCAPCPNLHSSAFEEGKASIEYLTGFFNKICYSGSCPVPASHPAVVERKVINGMDPACNLVKYKKNWEDYKLQILKFCNDNMMNKTGISPKKMRVEVPLNVLLLADHLRKDPDPYFSSNYNSYFNGSNITSLDMGLDKFLIRPRSYEKGEIVLSQLYLNDGHWDVGYESLAVSSTEMPGPVYEIAAAKDVILTRQKQSISLFSLDSGGNGFTVQKKLTVENNCPVFSVCTNGNNFCFLSAEKEIEIFDVIVGRPVLREKLFHDADIMSDSWGSVYYEDNNTLTLLDRSSCSLIDLRVKADVLKNWPIKDITEHCEEVYTGGTGSNKLQYIVTSHQVLSLDLRIGFSQRWTHGIGHSPSVMSVLSPSSVNDTVFIGSQRNDTVVHIENAWNENKTFSKVQPYALPSLRETFHLSQFNGYCLSNTIACRFSMSLTGLCCMENQGVITLFRTTSVGDLFKQTLTKCYEEKEYHLKESELNKIEDWEEQCEDLLLEQNNPCFVTDLLDDTNLLNCIQSKQKQYEESCNKLDMDRTEWSVSKKELMSYCDYLAPRILGEWGIDNEEEWCLVPDKVFNELSSDDENITERVAEWIEKYAEDMASPTVQQEQEHKNKETTNHEDQEHKNKETTNHEGQEHKNKETTNDCPLDVNQHTIEKSENDLKGNFSSTEPSFQKTTTSTPTPRKKFISGF